MRNRARSLLWAVAVAAVLILSPDSPRAAPEQDREVKDLLARLATGQPLTTEEDAAGGCDGIKLEGGVAMADRVEAIVNAGIPVMGHLGLTPQSMSMLGGFKAQGKDAQIAKTIIDDAQVLEEAGAFSILLEAVPSKVSKLVTTAAT